MFVKVAFSGGECSIYECSHCHILNLSKDEVAFELEGNGIEGHGTYRRIDVNKDTGTEVYLMNNEGRTIDVYRWPMQAEVVSETITA